MVSLSLASVRPAVAGVVNNPVLHKGFVVLGLGAVAAAAFRPDLLTRKNAAYAAAAVVGAVALTVLSASYGVVVASVVTGAAFGLFCKWAAADFTRASLNAQTVALAVVKGAVYGYAAQGLNAALSIV